MKPDIFFLIEHLQNSVLEISYLMAAAARRLSQIVGGDTVAVLLGQGNLELVGDVLADRVLYVDHPALADFTPDSYLQALASIIQDEAPRAFLFGHTSIGMDLASGLSARLGLPVVSQCKTIAESDGAPHFICQIYGGRILAEAKLPASTALVTMIPGGFKPDAGRSLKAPPATRFEKAPAAESRFKLIQYIEPDVADVDVSKEDILIAVGRGLQNQDGLAQVEELAAALNGVVCASRPIVDLGWLPTTRLVGKSGKSVRPKLYLALGISGAPEHVEGITNSETIIAINTDPNAPIFDVAQYGAVIDMFDLMGALTSKAQGIKVG